jgi:hypothetical protein
MMAFQFGLRDKVMINAIYGKVRVGLAALMGDIAPEMISVYKEKYDNRHPFDYQGIQTFLDSKESLLNKINIQSADSQLIIDEYRNAIRLIRTGVDLQYYIQNRRSLSISEEKAHLQSLKSILVLYLDENERLWKIRNKPGGYEASTAKLISLQEQIDTRIAVLDKSSFSRGLNRFFEKVGTAGAVLYLSSISK